MPNKEKTTRDWSSPNSNINKIDVAFGPRNLSDFLPAWDAIPKDFLDDDNPYAKATSQWFFRGLPKNTLHAKSGIDETQALAHLKCILGSFEPAHEHKEAGVAYLMSLWFEEPKL